MTFLLFYDKFNIIKELHFNNAIFLDFLFIFIFVLLIQQTLGKPPQSSNKIL